MMRELVHQTLLRVFTQEPVHQEPAPRSPVRRNRFKNIETIDDMDKVKYARTYVGVSTNVLTIIDTNPGSSRL